MMRAVVPAAIFAASLVGGNGALAACASGSAQKCVDFGAVPQISEQIVAKERIAPAAKAAPGTDTSTSYTGPTVGTAPNLRRAPTIGYRWAIN